MALGKGLVLESLTQMPTFMLSVACAAGFTVLFSWVITLPCAALLASLFYLVFSRTLG